MTMQPEKLLFNKVGLYCGDCLEVMATLDADSVDSCVTDPPYHLSSIVKRFGKPGSAEAKSDGATGVYKRASAGFMGKVWDGGEIAYRPETWAAVYRVLKPGAHLVAFGATRGYHRMACAIEDAGFEIRDGLMWLYGTGFPKSHDAAQSIEKTLTTGVARRPDRDLGGLPRDRFSGDIEGRLIANTGGKVELTTPEAQEWEGWGTALKPAWEPIVLARKPLSEGTVAANVLRWRTGALNIDACRVENPDYDPTKTQRQQSNRQTWQGGNASGFAADHVQQTYNVAGRWPANVVHDGSDEVVGAFPTTKSGMFLPHHRASGKGQIGTFDIRDRGGEVHPTYGDSGSAARFFYSAKANKADRALSKHPTVKPVSLKQWLVRLVTPLRGIVLDPFAGTGTTGEAAWRECFSAVLIEAEPEYQADIRRRMAMAAMGPEERARFIAKMAEAANDNGSLFTAAA